MRKGLLVLAIASVLMFLPLGAFADSITINCSNTSQCSGGTYQVILGITGSSADWTLTFDLSGPAGGTFNGFSVNNALTGSQSLISVSGGSGFANAGFNNGNGSCGGGGGDFCLEDPSPFGGSASYTVHISGGTLLPASNWTVIANIKQSDGNGNLLALSTGGSPSTPEPASIALLSAGLIGLGGLIRRHKS